jgi:hypothetical protein
MLIEVPQAYGPVLKAKLQQNRRFEVLWSSMTQGSTAYHIAVDEHTGAELLETQDWIWEEASPSVWCKVTALPDEDSD